MQCDGCGQTLTLVDTDLEEDELAYLLCPNFSSAFQDFIAMEQEYFTNDQLGTYPCERIYTIPRTFAYI